MDKMALYSHALTVPNSRSRTTSASRAFAWFLLGCLVHLPLAVLPRQYAWASTLHALATLGLGLWFLVHDQTPRRVVYVAAYIVGAEVLWRMTGAGIYWEYGKYASILLLALAMFRWPIKIYPLPLLYFMLLVPGIALTVGAMPDLAAARDAVSFNLSGPLALAIAAVFFQGYTFSRSHFRDLLLVMLIPIIGIGFRVLYGILAAGEINFSLNSNFTASGGFGPNQVSAILGLGALLCLIYMLLDSGSLFRRLVLGGMMVWLIVQSMLTYSRGGVFNFLLAAPTAAWFLAGSQRHRRRSLALGLTFLLALAFVMFPYLNDWTGGTLALRFQDTDLTGRDEIISTQLQIWLNNPLQGVGPGVSDDASIAFFGRSIASHTEFSRLLAEHGVFGLMALALILLVPLRRFFRAEGIVSRGLLLALTIWSLAEMSHAAMRIAAISFVYGLPMAKFEDGD